jgi:hypothetical protein
VTLALRPMFPEFFGRRTIPVGTANDTDFVIADPDGAASPTEPAASVDRTTTEA